MVSWSDPQKPTSHRGYPGKSASGRDAADFSSNEAKRGPRTQASSSASIAGRTAPSRGGGGGGAWGHPASSLRVAKGGPAWRQDHGVGVGPAPWCSPSSCRVSANTGRSVAWQVRSPPPVIRQDVNSSAATTSFRGRGQQHYIEALQASIREDPQIGRTGLAPGQILCCAGRRFPRA